MARVTVIVLRVSLVFVLLAGWVYGEDAADTAASMIVVVGAGGTEEYAEVFTKCADDWKKAAEFSRSSYNEVGRRGEKDREKLRELILANKAAQVGPLWLILIGHGTFDRNIAKFNLRGPDFSATELKEWLSDCERPLVVVNCFSSSGAFLNELQGENRVVITATSSGAEQNYSRFGRLFAESLTDMDADLDHDNQVSLLETYLLASSKVARFYEEASRLATEHSLLEDNQDGKGTPADFFVGIRAEGKAKSGAVPDGRLAHRYILASSNDAPQLNANQLQKRDRIEIEIEALRDRKSALSEEEYYQQLEVLMIELATLYEAV